MEFHGAPLHLDGGTVLILAHQVMYVDIAQVLFLKKKKKTLKNNYILFLKKCTKSQCELKYEV